MWPSQAPSFPATMSRWRLIWRGKGREQVYGFINCGIYLYRLHGRLYRLFAYRDPEHIVILIVSLRYCVSKVNPRTAQL